MELTGLVMDIDRFSTHDGPGIRTTVFLKGCPLSCKWCHSPESQAPGVSLIYQRARCRNCLSCIGACPHGAVRVDGQKGGVFIDREKCRLCFACTNACHTKALRTLGEKMTVGQVMETVVKDVPYFKNSGGGVTVSGGEVLSQPEFTYHLLRECAERGIHTAIETSGYGSAKHLLKIADVCSLIYYDVKLPDTDRHKEYTGAGSERIIENLTALCKESAAAEKITVRIPCIPGINDSAADIKKTAAVVKQLGVSSIEIMPYNPMAAAKYEWIGEAYQLDGLEPRDELYYEELRKIGRF